MGSRLGADLLDGVVDDAAVVLVAERLPHQLLGDTDREPGHFATQLLAGAPDVRLGLGPGGLDETAGLGLRRFDELSLLLSASFNACSRMAAAS